MQPAKSRRGVVVLVLAVAMTAMATAWAPALNAGAQSSLDCKDPRSPELHRGDT